MDSLELSENLTVTGTSTLSGRVTTSGTTTISSSFDGFELYDDFTMGTGTAKVVASNNLGADLICRKNATALYFDSTTDFSPSLQVALGTSTTATGYSTNLKASTTIASTSDQVIDITYASSFLLKIGESIVGALSDTQGTNSSSTNYGNWTGHLKVPCSLVSG